MEGVRRKFSANLMVRMFFRQETMVFSDLTVIVYPRKRFHQISFFSFEAILTHASCSSHRIAPDSIGQMQFSM